MSGVEEDIVFINVSLAPIPKVIPSLSESGRKKGLTS
jgi:hypothetical protein